MAFVSLIEMLNVVFAVAAEATGTKEEKKPAFRGTQGAVKEDCVTVWFLGIVSPVKSRVENEGWGTYLGKEGELNGVADVCVDV